MLTQTMTKRLAALVIGLAGMLLVPGSASANSWMMFAVDEHGAVGHGMSPDPQIARNLALSYCGNSKCKAVRPATQANCQALAHSFVNGYWLGLSAANTKGEAIGAAINFCAKNAPASSCKLAYVYCQ